MIAAVEYHDLVLRGAAEKLIVAPFRDALYQNLELLTHVAAVAPLR